MVIMSASFLNLACFSMEPMSGTKPHAGGTVTLYTNQLQRQHQEDIKSKHQERCNGYWHRLQQRHGLNNLFISGIQWTAAVECP